MVAKAASHLSAATALAMLASASVADSARAQAASCLATPNGAAPAGTHWYYKTDQATHQKCWYTRPQDQTAAAAPAQITLSRAATSPAPAERGDSANPDADAVPDQATAPIALAPAAAPQVPARAVPKPPAAPRRIAAPSARIPMPAADPRGEPQPITTAAVAAPAPPAAQTTSVVRWPDPPSLPQTAGDAGSPFPPPPTVSPQADAPGAPIPSPAAPMPSGVAPSPAASAVPSAAAQPPTADKPETAAGKAGADNPSAAKPPGRISVLLVLGGLIALLTAGMLLRGLVEHALSRRRVIKLARQEPRLVESVAAPPPMPKIVRQAPSVVPGHGQAAQRASEVEAELRRFAESLRQRRPAANDSANVALGRNGAALRS